MGLHVSSPRCDMQGGAICSTTAEQQTDNLQVAVPGTWEFAR